MDWRDRWSRARLDLGLSDATFWALTLRDYTALVTVWQEREARQDRRAQALISAVYNIMRPASHPEPYSFDDFPIHQWPLAQQTRRTDDPAPRPATAEEVAWSELTLLRAKTSATYGKEAAVIHTKRTSTNGKKRDG